MTPLLPLNSVNIKATTWTQESKDLFDFESSHFLEKSLEAHASTALLRVNDDIQTVDSQLSPIENQENILSLKKDNGNTLFSNSIIHIHYFFPKCFNLSLSRCLQPLQSSSKDR